MSFGKNLRKLRESRGIERKELAIKFEMPYNTLKNYENDEREPGHSFIIKVAKYFGVSADFLLDNNLENLQNPIESSVNVSIGALELARAYDKADLKSKNIARQALDLPVLQSDPPANETSVMVDRRSAV